MSEEGNPIEEILEESGRIEAKDINQPELCENQAEVAQKAREHELDMPDDEKHKHNITIFGKNGSHRCTCGKVWEVK